MTKIKKRNALSIFNDFRLKQPTTSIKIEDFPKDENLHSLNLLCKLHTNTKAVSSWWKKNVDGRLVQVNELGEPNFSGERGFEKEIPIETSLKTNKSKILVTINKYNFSTSWWTSSN